MKGIITMKSKTISTAATLDIYTIELMDHYLEISGVKTAMMMFNAMELYKVAGYRFELYEIVDGQVKRFRAFEETVQDVYEMAKQREVTNSIIWNQIIRDYVICKLYR